MGCNRSGCYSLDSYWHHSGVWQNRRGGALRHLEERSLNTITRPQRLAFSRPTLLGIQTVLKSRSFYRLSMSEPVRGGRTSPTSRASQHRQKVIRPIAHLKAGKSCTMLLVLLHAGTVLCTCAATEACLHGCLFSLPNDLYGEERLSVQPLVLLLVRTKHWAKVTP